MDGTSGTTGEQAGAELRRLRHDRGWSLAEMARKVPYSKSYLSKLETGAKRFTPDIARCLDEALGTGGALAAVLATAESPVLADDDRAVAGCPYPGLAAFGPDQARWFFGQRVLEIGAATGINAALLAELAGPTGTVVTIELDDDLAAGAAKSLETAGYPQVKVICGDGALGHPGHAPYERIIVTAEAWDLVPAWWDQLTVGGRLVVPLRLHGSGLTRAIAFDLHQPDQMVSTSAVVCGFVPLRGAAGHAEHHVRLADDVVLKLDAADLPDHAALAHTLTHPAQQSATATDVTEAAGDDALTYLASAFALVRGGAAAGNRTPDLLITSHPTVPLRQHPQRR
ncbi:MAG: helix-turn-helix domain-containing protein [Pseudonocardiaceae bacterium]